jgi:hypothetical protein
MKKNIAEKMSFYLIITMSFCLFIAILLVKNARLTRALLILASKALLDIKA